MIVYHAQLVSSVLMGAGLPMAPVHALLARIRKLVQARPLLASHACREGTVFLVLSQDLVQAFVLPAHFPSLAPAFPPRAHRALPANSVSRDAAVQLAQAFAPLVASRLLERGPRQTACPVLQENTASLVARPRVAAEAALPEVSRPTVPG